MNRPIVARRVLLALAALLVVAVPGMLAGASAGGAKPPRTTRTTVAPTTTTLPGSSRSGLPWRHGVHTGSFPPDYPPFEAWSGKLLDWTLQYSARSSWAGIEHPWHLGYDFPGEQVAAQPFWPEGSGGSFAACSSGSYDTHWRAYGSALIAEGKPATLTSLAWEFNGDWFEWSVGADPAGYAACYRRVVSQVHVTDPSARFAWVMNAHSGDPTPAYPGDGWVDLIGIDTYDQWPASTSQAVWDAQITAPAGLQWAYDLAVTHGKGFIIQEWGLLGPADANHGGDNVLFVTNMLAWIHAHPGVWESYFDVPGSSGQHHSIFAQPVYNPNGATAYLAGLHG